jgi:hypothetical protein
MMSLQRLKAELPVWARDADLPQPLDGEPLIDYVRRLGFDADFLFDGLTDREAPVAYLRFNHVLREVLPDVWDHFLAEQSSHYLSAERLREIDRMAQNLFPMSYRRTRTQV